MKRVMIAAALGLSGLLIGTAAQAQVYVGGSVGESWWNANCAGATNCSTRNNVYDMVGGYNLDAHWGVEASYYSLGTIGGEVSGVTANIRATGEDLSAVYRTELGNQWTLFGKIGATSNRVEVSDIQSSGSAGYSNRSADPVAAIGVTWALRKDFAFRFEFDERRVKVDVPNYSGSGNVARLNIGFIVTF